MIFINFDYILIDIFVIIRFKETESESFASLRKIVLVS